MIRTVNKVILVGVVYGKVKFNYFPNGTKVANFAIQTHAYKKSASGAYETVSEISRCVVWGDHCPTMESDINEGNKVYAEGRLSTTKYKDKKNNWQYLTQIVCDEVILQCRPKNEKDEKNS